MREPSRAEPVAALDPCAPVWWRPDRAFADYASCRRGRDLGEIAARGGVVLFGSSWDVAERHTVLPPDRRCEGPVTHGQNGAFIQDIVRRRPPAAPPIAFVHLHRFDLVPASLAAQPGFDAGFLLRTRRPWSEVLEFFSEDRSPLCRGGRCAWSDSFLGDPQQDPGARLRDLIDRSGGSGFHGSVVYYLSSAGPGKRVQWPDAALADLRNPRYRAWRIEEARRAVQVGGYDAILLNDKFAQYLHPKGHWLGSDFAPDVEALNRTGTTLWSAPPDGYGFPEYVEGWAALGRELGRAGVPYALSISNTPWRNPGFDNARSPGVHEARLLRELARGARIVVVGGPTDRAVEQRIEQDLRGSGASFVLRDAGPDVCGRAGEGPSQ